MLSALPCHPETPFLAGGLPRNFRWITCSAPCYKGSLQETELHLANRTACAHSSKHCIWGLSWLSPTKAFLHRWRDSSCYKTKIIATGYTCITQHSTELRFGLEVWATRLCAAQIQEGQWQQGAQPALTQSQLQLLLLPALEATHQGHAGESETVLFWSPSSLLL